MGIQLQVSNLNIAHADYFEACVDLVLNYKSANVAFTVAMHLALSRGAGGGGTLNILGRGVPQGL